MTASREPSYYEIALTHRQVLAIFVVLLACVVVAFFSGVWVGRQDVTPQVEVADGAAAVGVDPDGEALGELRFFSEADDEPAAGQDAGPAPAPPVAATPAPAPAPAPPSSSTPPAGDEPAAAAGDLVIQVFSSSERDQAQRVVDRLRAASLPALLSPVEVRDRTMYRVRIGPYGDRGEAEAVAERVRRDFRLDTWITR